MQVDRRLLWDKVTIVRRTQTGTDGGGNPTYGWADDPRPVPANVQPASGSEDDSPDDTTLLDMRRMWLLPDVDLSAGDRVRIDGTVWQVEGPPHRWTTAFGPHHLEAKLKLAEDV